jgi:hypothetical protein
MDLSKSTRDFLSSLEEFSGGKFTRRDDLGTLIELATLHHRSNTLDGLGFIAKFIHKTHGIMQRVGAKREGYDKLGSEITDAIKRASSYIETLVADAPEPIRDHFISSYTQLNHASLENLLDLCHDLSWYKNWMIDHASREKR